MNELTEQYVAQLMDRFQGWLDKVEHHIEFGAETSSLVITPDVPQEYVIDFQRIVDAFPPGTFPCLDVLVKDPGYSGAHKRTSPEKEPSCMADLGKAMGLLQN